MEDLMAQENKLGDITKTALESIRSMLDANTIIGEPIKTAGGTEIIPISKISVGYASGGVDYINKEVRTANNFGGGGGTGITVSPVAFLVVNADGNVNILNIDAPTVVAPAPDTIAQVVSFIERSPDLINRLKAVLGKKGEENNI